MTDYTKKLVNRSNVKKYALAQAELRSGTKLERVSGEVFEELNAKVQKLIEELVASAPDTGKTVFGWSRKEVTEVVPAAEVPVA